MSSPPPSDQPTRPEPLKKLAQLQIDRLKNEVCNALSATFAEVILSNTCRGGGGNKVEV
jgi:hypothetical protein